MNSSVSRRYLLGLSAAATLCPTLLQRAWGQRADTRPNIVFIMADDMGPFDLGCYGQKEIQTPHMDRAAAEGMRFTDCYAGASVCAPSRSVLMTGQHTGHTRIRANMSTVNGRRVALRADDFTVAELLKGPEWKGAFDETRAYTTGIFGKWGLGEPGSTGLPNDHGFDEWYGFLNQQHAHEHYPRYLWRNQQRETLHGNADGGKREYASDLFAREALYFLERHRYERFFLYFTPTVPHAKLEAPDLGPYANKPWPEDAKNYAAMVTRFDRYVGQILDKLKETGLDENTVVFITSDNGGTSEFGPFASMGPLRQKKGALYEGGLRVPMIVRWPGKVRAGSVSHMPWSFQDVFPTVAELAEARSIPANVDGRSVVPTLLGKEQSTERPLYWEQIAGRTLQQALRVGDWKAVRLKREGPVELYNLAKDPGESRNVAGENPAVVEKMEGLFRSMRTASEEYPVQGD